MHPEAMPKRTLPRARSMLPTLLPWRPQRWGNVAIGALCYLHLPGRDSAVPGALMLRAQLRGELHPTWGVLPHLPARL